jgi:hypothetical protein
VWAIRPDGVAVVIQVTKAIQVPYEPPLLPKTDIDRNLLAVAQDIMRRRRLAAAAKSKDWYQQKFIVKPDHKDLVLPTDDEVAVARTIIAQDNHNERVHKIYRAAHYASTAVAAARLFDLWMKDQPEEH